ncbi:MAG: tetratricopeptide repeat protein [Polyangiales bacterium]
MPAELEEPIDATTVDPQRVRELEHRARRCASLGQHEAALALLDEAVALDPNVGVLYYLRANARCALGETDATLDDFARALALGFDSYGVFHDRALARAEAGDEDGALEDYNEALARLPTAPESRNNRAMIFLRRGAYEAALEDLRVAVASTDGVTENGGLYECSMAEVLCALERWDEAAEAMRAAIAASPRWREYVRTADELRGIRDRFK